jgi:hypothetical protein
VLLYVHGQCSSSPFAVTGGTLAAGSRSIFALQLEPVTVISGIKFKDRGRMYLAIAGAFRMLDITVGPVAALDNGPSCFDTQCTAQNAADLSNGSDAISHLETKIEELMLLNRHGRTDDLAQFRLVLGLCSSIQHHLAGMLGDDDKARALWCFGQSARYGQTGYVRNWGRLQFDLLVADSGDLATPRAMAFAALGAAFILDADPAHAPARDLLERHGSLLFQLLKSSSRPDWTWFETVVDGDSFHLPDALIRAAEHLGQHEWLQAGADARCWMQKVQHGGAAAHGATVSAATQIAQPAFS